MSLTQKVHALAALLGALLLASGCGEGLSNPESPATTTATVRFVYRALTAIDPLVAAEFPLCVAAVDHTHIHPSWRGFQSFDMSPQSTQFWEASFSDVPVGERLGVRINDPNACALNPTGAATANVFANEVLLTTATPGAGSEPGFQFSVAADGRVMP